MVSDIYKQNKIERMQEVANKIPDLLVNMAVAEASADSVGHLITSITDAITLGCCSWRRRLGPPPVRYVWVAAGSQARNEQTAKSDQDNCMIIDDAYDPRIHADYFRSWRNSCDGLNACGYIYCPGEMMAITDKWRQPLTVWKGYFEKWIDQPEPMSLMLTSVFSTCAVFTAHATYSEIAEYALEKHVEQDFSRVYGGNALSHQPPIGFFPQFCFDQGRRAQPDFRRKTQRYRPDRGSGPCLQPGCGQQGGQHLDRLDVVAEGGEVTSEGAHDLKDALEFICYLRIQHQARLIKAGEPADNFMSPDHLSHFERNHLKDAFSVVRTMQNTP